MVARKEFRVVNLQVTQVVAYMILEKIVKEIKEYYFRVWWEDRTANETGQRILQDLFKVRKLITVKLAPSFP